MMRRLLVLTGLFLFVRCEAQEQPFTVFSWSGGLYAPFGIRVAEEMPSGFAGYLTGRCNLAAFTDSRYTIKNGRINDAEWTWTYLDKKKYARTEIYVGFQFPVIRPQKLLGTQHKIGLTAWAGAGMLYARYLYQFDRALKQNVGGPTWVRDLDQGGVGFDMEAGVQVRYGRVRIHFGNSGFFHRTEPMFVAGIGVPLRYEP